MKQPPTVSVLMPAFNAGEYLVIAVQSILNQTFANFELIIIDDGSTDESFKSIAPIQDERVKLIRNRSNLGIVASRNLGLQAASAPLVACLDADDVALPSRLELQVAAFNSDPDLVLLGGSAYLIDGLGEPFGVMDVPSNESEIRHTLYRSNKFVHSTAMIRTSAIRAIGGYPSKYHLGEDYALWLKIAASYKIANLPARLVKYRVHSGQISQQSILAMWLMTRLIQKDSWANHNSLIPPSDMLPPREPNMWASWRGKEGSLGFAYLAWAKRCTAMNDRATAVSLIERGLKTAPLCKGMYFALLSLVFKIGSHPASFFKR